MDTLSLANLLEKGREWHDRYSCGSCHFGYSAASPPLPTDKPRYLAQLEQWRAGASIFCDCEAGERMRRSVEAIAVRESAVDVAMAAEIKQRKAARLNRIFEDAQVPPRFAAFSASTYKTIAGNDPGKQKAISTVTEYYRNGSIMVDGVERFGIYLHGLTDQGKTGLLCPLFLYYVRAGASGLWVQYNDLQASLRDFESGKVNERIETAQRTEYLFIDDWGDPMSDRAATDYTRDTMFRIIDYRNNYRKPTFITSNVSPAKLAGQFHDRIGKRLAELCAVVEVTGTPMRELAAQAQRAAEQAQRAAALDAARQRRAMAGAVAT